MSDAFYRFVLPCYGVALIAWIAGMRAILRRQADTEPIVARPGTDLDSPERLLETAQLACAIVGFADLLLNALAPRWVATHLAIPALRRSTVVAASGAGLVTAGLGLVFVAIVTMGRSWRIGIDRRTAGLLVTRGVFRYVRHPIYAGMLFATLGFAMAISDVASWTVAGATWVGLPLQARLEEAFLVGHYGEGYRAYQDATGRFWPRARRRPRTAGSLA
jgi:protein-S-isoprenylcysteine O-methyltransferase Ste14